MTMEPMTTPWLRNWPPDDDNGTDELAFTPTSHYRERYLAWSEERVEPAMIDYHSRPGRVAAHWVPYLLILAAIAVLAVLLAADDRVEPDSIAPAPFPSTLLMPAPPQPLAPQPLAPQPLAPLPPAAAVPAPTITPEPTRPPASAVDPDGVFLQGLARLGWPLERFDTTTLAAEGRSVCAILRGPAAGNESVAASVIVEQYGTSTLRAAQFVSVAHNAYCVTGVIA